MGIVSFFNIVNTVGILLFVLLVGIMFFRKKTDTPKNIYVEVLFLVFLIGFDVYMFLNDQTAIKPLVVSLLTIAACLQVAKLTKSLRKSN
ncbi:DUF2569 family protein [Brevibacillus laterosporus]|uniref:Uncharacterized protein n=1 Tax=Brevibacillus laterosporus LMG 15441 TaxID=1042163 RepID=A0A075R999_BRELA|nr:DUF2569 family protein [Brevibacillus laterosporus]AIG28449.1 hypothetical protein BRLA_c041740 [Brevibacillus laterosporus LMG 15441]RJL13517.1 DUF2569 family protein [Brevibacillus laterosporus]